MSGCALGVDIGTSGVRAASIRESGDVAALSAISFASLGENPRAPAAWWRATTACIEQLRAESQLARVVALAVDGTSGTMLAINETGDPVGDAHMYDEPCHDEAIVARIGEAAPPDSPARGATSALARFIAMQDRPGARRVLHQADWIAGKLSGSFDITDENNALKTGYDPVQRHWPGWLKTVGADLSKLPQALEVGAPIGRVNAAARGLGLPAEAVVVAGTTDGCASFLATGASHAGEGVTALGSTLVIKLLSDSPVSSAAAGVYSHRLGARWLVGGASNTGGKVIQHLFGEADLNELSRALRPDVPTGLHYYPLLRPGERFPISDPTLAPRLTPRPADPAVFFQGVLEGIAEIEALAYRKLAELGAPALKSVRSVGGGSANARWTSIRQRLVGAPFAPSLSSEACVGAARIALARVKAN